MKKVSIVTCAMLLSLSAMADDVLRPMLVQGKTWWYTHHHFEEKEQPANAYDETVFPVSYTLMGDTVINGLPYMKVYRRSHENYKQGVLQYYGAYREDDGKIYGVANRENAQEELLSDLRNGHAADATPVIETIMVYGKTFRRFCYPASASRGRYVGVEGVGYESLEGAGGMRYGLFGDPIFPMNCICDYEEFDYVTGGGIYFTAQDFQAPRYIELTDGERQLVAGNNDFAFRLFRETRGTRSSIMSPLSITYALGMLNNGAAGQTQQEICDVLGFGEAGADGINNFCRKMLNEAPTLDENTAAEIANTIYVNSGKDYELQQGFVDKANEFYDAQPESRNFYDGVTWEVINQWACDHTHGMIPKVFPTKDSFNEDACSYLLNAIYFKGIWASQFDKADTRDEAFNGGNTVPMMRQTADFKYTENELYQAVCLPYGNGAYQMTVFLPREGKTVNDVLSQMDGHNWQVEGYKSTVNLKMPRIKTETDLQLVQPMSDLGMPTAFSIVDAEFPYFGNRAVFISDMFQKAVIELDEEGTKAAAVTVIDVTDAMPMVIDFHANRPFFYIISEQSTGIIFFIGQYMGEEDTAAITLHDASDTQHNPSAIYSLSGQRLSSAPARGLYIRGGKKFAR